MSNFFCGLLWGVILTVLGASVIASTAPSRDSVRQCDVYLKDRAGIEVVILDQPCGARV
jgi:hypothetical protein